MKAEVLKALAETRLVAIIRGMDPEICVRLAEAYAEGGIRLVEVTFDQTGDPAKTIAAIKAIREGFAGRLHVGADIVKVFPVRSLGPQYVKDVLAPLKHISLMAVGGVNPDNAADYLKAGCIGVGASGSLVNKEWIAAGEWSKIADEARRFIANLSC